MTTQTTLTILNNAIAASQNLLTQYALNGELVGDFVTAFGSEYNREVAEDLITQWQTENFSSLPKFEVLSSAEINGANGAFSAATNTVYISAEFLLANTDNLNAITDLVLEEYGHYVDSQINTVDAAGDEGDIFSGLVRGESFTNGELQQLKLENDQAVVNIDGQEIAIEQREASVSTLPENFAIKGDVTNLHIGDFNGDGFDDFLRQEKGSFDNDNRNTANIFFSNGNGSFRKSDLPENFAIKGDLTNLHVGDFNGDGFDDFLRQEKGRFDDDNVNTANIFFSNGNGTFRKSDLPENFSIKGDLTNLHIGDFNGDGFDDFLRQEKGVTDDDNRRTANIFFSDGNGSFSQIGLPENFDLKGDLTNLHVGDFNGDGFDDFLRQGRRDSDISDRIFFSNGNGSFSETPLPFSTLGSTSRTVTNIEDVGDFNGDGFDDLLIQESTPSVFFGSSSTRRASILFSDGNGGFSNEARLSSTGFAGFGITTLEGFHLDAGTANLHIGDFDGNGVNELLRQERGNADNDNVDTAQIFSNLGFNISGGAGNDSINGGAGNDSMILCGLKGGDASLPWRGFANAFY